MENQRRCYIPQTRRDLTWLQQASSIMLRTPSSVLGPWIEDRKPSSTRCKGWGRDFRGDQGGLEWIEQSKDGALEPDGPTSWLMLKDRLSARTPYSYEHSVVCASFFARKQGIVIHHWVRGEEITKRVPGYCATGSVFAFALTEEAHSYQTTLVGPPKDTKWEMIVPR